ncbi:MAG TPA: BadF/BadG/BcrA/BcrD ATPase family protein [Xanthobacteraceae bacterium]|jgi:N-acetylglucosamine kinase-like BadF-type ATPase
MSGNLFLGVDGGGTRTRFVLIGRTGELVAACEGPTSDHLQVGIDGVREVLTDGLAALLREAQASGSEIAYAFFGLPTYGEDRVAQVLLDGLPERLLGHRRYRCGNDMIGAWAGSLGGKDGINIVAGTGSIGYGERKGRSARAGGWGESFSDEGSAYWIATQALNSFTRMSDGRLPKGPLYTIFRAHLGLDADLELCAKLANAQSRRSIAALAQLVAQAAHERDLSAVRIFDGAARELAAIIEAVRQALKFEPDEGVPVSYSGGVFEAGELILAPLREYIERHSVNYELKAPILAPSLGAAIYAARLAARPLSVAAIDRLMAGSVTRSRAPPP